MMNSIIERYFVTTQNSIILDSTRHVQLELSCSKTERVWLQILLDCHITNRKTQKVMLNVYELNEPTHGKKISRGLYDLYKKYRMSPFLPSQRAPGLVQTEYMHNGYIFNLEANKHYVLVFSTGQENPDAPEAKNFMIRTLTKEVTMHGILE